VQRDIRKSSSSTLSMTIPFFFSLLSPRPPPQNYGKSCVSKLSKKRKNVISPLFVLLLQVKFLLGPTHQSHPILIG